MIEEGIVALALADPTTVGLISNRFYAINLPQVTGSTVALPAVTYRIISTTEQYTMDGPLGLSQCRMQIDCYGASYSDAKAVSVALRNVLNGYSGTLPNGCEVFSVIRDGSNSGYDEMIRLPYVSTDWLIQFSE